MRRASSTDDDDAHLRQVVAAVTTARRLLALATRHARDGGAGEDVISTLDAEIVELDSMLRAVPLARVAQSRITKRPRGRPPLVLPAETWADVDRRIAAGETIEAIAPTIRTANSRGGTVGRTALRRAIMCRRGT